MLTILDKAAAVTNGHVQQAAPDTVDIAALVAGLAGTRVILTGCTPSPSGMGVAVTAGTAVVPSASTTIFTGGTASIASNTSGSDRIDLISLYWTGTVIGLRVTQGTPGVPGFVPQVPALPTTDVLVARVDVPTSASSIVAGDLLDKRCFGPGAGSGAYQPPVAVAASTANVASLTGTPNLDGFATSPGQIVFLGFQTTAKDNGLWITGTPWTRPGTFASGGTITAYQVFILNGTNYGDTLWELTNGPVVIDTDAQVWARMNYVDTTTTQTIGGLKTFTGTMTAASGLISGSDIAMGAHHIINLLDPSFAQDAATKNYVDTTPKRTPHLVVAASNANAVYKQKADYVCDGTADEVEINAAIAALTLGGTGGTVELTDGTFTVAAAIALTGKVTLMGQGRLSTRIQRSGTATFITYNGTATGSANHVSRGEIRRLLIDGQTSAGVGIMCHYADTFVFEDVQVQGCLGEGLQLVECWDSSLIECRFINCGSVNGTGTPAVGIYQNLSGVASSDNCNNIRFFGCTIESFVDAGLKIIGAGTGSLICYRIDFEGCKIESVIGIKGHQITLDYTERATFRDCYFIHSRFAGGFSTPVDTFHITNSIYPTIDGCMFTADDTNRSLRSYVSLYTNVVGAWVTNCDISVGATNYPTVAAIDNADTAVNNYNNQVEVYDFSFDGHGGSVLYNQGVGKQRVRYNPTVGDRAGPVWAEGSANIWGLLHYQGGSTLVLRDWTNGRNLVTYTQGPDAFTANAEYNSSLQVDGTLSVHTPAALGTSAVAIDSDVGSEARLTLKNNGTVYWTLQKIDGDGNLYVWDRVNNRKQIILTPGTSSANALVEFASKVQIDDQLDMQSHKIISVTDPTNPQDAATKAYVDAKIAAVPQPSMIDAGPRPIMR